MPPNLRSRSTAPISPTANTLPSKAASSSAKCSKPTEAHCLSPEPDVPATGALPYATVSQAPLPTGEGGSEPVVVEPEPPRAEAPALQSANAVSSKLPKRPPVSNASESSASETSAPMKLSSATAAFLLKADAIKDVHARGEAFREHCRENPTINAPPPTSVSTLDQLLAPKKGCTGNTLVDSVMEDMKHSRFCLWLGDSKKVLQNCHWVKNTASNTHILMLKKDSPFQSAGGDGPALIGFMGQISGDTSTMTPDAGFTYEESKWDENLFKRKRWIAFGPPGVETRFPRSFWDDQIKGYNAIADDSRRSTNKNNMVGTMGTFYDPDNMTLRAGCPLFLPPPIEVRGSDDEDTEADVDAEELRGENNPGNDIPEDYQYPTWSITLPRVQSLFDELINRGYQPQILDAYDRSNALIHPNDVHSALSGTIAYMYVTLEKRLFTRTKFEGGKAWHFSANLIKVQALKAKAPPPPSALKRKDLHGYSMRDVYQNSSMGEPSSKRVKF